MHVIGPLWEGAPKKIEEQYNGRLIVHRVSSVGSLPGVAQALARSAYPPQSFSWQAGKLIEELVDQEGIDVIEAQDYCAPLYYFQIRRALGLGPKRRPPCFVHLHSPSEFIVTHNEWDPGHPYFLTAKRLEDFSIAASDAWLCPSKYLAREVEANYGLDSGSVEVIPLPIGNNPLLERTEQVWSNGTICYVGRLEPRKGVIEWVDAAISEADKFPSAHFEFIGDDLKFWDGASVKHFIKRRIPPRMMARFHFRGRHSREELAGILGKARIAVVPSRWENFPNTCVEAMCSGLPVIATRAGGMVEMIKDNQTGWLSVNSRSDGLAKALERALETPPTQLAEMGRQAALEIRKICKNQEIVGKHLDFRRQVCLRGAGRSLRIPVNLPWARRPLFDEFARRHAKKQSAHGIAFVIEQINDPRHLSKCLKNLESQKRTPEVVVILIDNHQEEILKPVLKRARSLGWLICEVAGQSAAERKNKGIKAVLSSGADPIAFVFLEEVDLLNIGFVEALEPVFSKCPEVGLVSSWMLNGSNKNGFIDHPCPAFPYQFLNNETIHATAIRTEALLEAEQFRVQLDSGFEHWDLINAVMAAGWAGITYPELLVRRFEPPHTIAGEQRRMRREILGRFPDAVARDAQELVHLLESSGFQLNSNFRITESLSINLFRPRDFFGLTLEQKIRVVRKAVQNPKSAVEFIIYHAKNASRTFGNRIWRMNRGEDDEWV